MSRRFIVLGAARTLGGDYRRNYRLWFGIPWSAGVGTRLEADSDGAPRLYDRLVKAKRHLLGEVDEFNLRGSELFFRDKAVNMDRFTDLFLPYRSLELPLIQQEKLRAIENFASSDAGLNIINPVESSRLIYNKDEFYCALGQYGLAHPRYQLVSSPDEISLQYPYLLRINNSRGGLHTAVVIDAAFRDCEFDKLRGALAAGGCRPGGRLIAVEMLDGYNRALGCFLSGRVFVCHNVVTYHYANASPVHWNLHLKDIKGTDPDMLREANLLVKRIIGESEEKILKVAQALKFDFFNLDFLVLDGEIVFLEAGHKFGPWSVYYDAQIVCAGLGKEFAAQLVCSGADSGIKDLFALDDY